MAEPAVQIIPLCERHGPAWFALRQAGSFQERAWLDRFVEKMPAGARSVLDLGCGGGAPIARYMSEQGLAVTGIDTSSSMLDICRDRSPDSDWIRADMRNLTLDRTFDGIIAWDSFFHLNQDDQRKMFAVFAAHANPGASLRFTAGPSTGEAIGELEGETLFHASLDPQEYRELLTRHGFDVVRYAAEDPDCGGHTIWLCRAHKERAFS